MRTFAQRDSRLPQTSSRGSERGGFTLIEILVISVLTIIVLGGLTTTLMRQQRFYRGTAELIDTRSQIRQAAGILPFDLRGISTIGGDLLAMTDTSMLFRATIGSSVVCLKVDATTVMLPPAVLANGNTLTSWSLEPGPGDTAFMYDDGPANAASDDQWRAYALQVAPVPVVGGCPLETGFTSASDATTASYSLGLTSNLATGILVGAPVRFVRTTRYSLYPAADGNWYLGYCSPTCGTGGPQPVAGPFLPYGGGVTPGVRFTYLAENGLVTATPSAVAQVSIVVRGETRGEVSISGTTQRVIGDSLRFTVGIRNRR
jgi:type II secretory pathway pseudopilin PulG